ncbi:MAG: zinc ribbon domain-containing protein [Chloroflexi bacterium]|nr:zinc ribbon domain-containing protein [Chloroflexota bacterium]
MALISCKKCGHSTSDKAKNCPQCGTAVGANAAATKQPQNRASLGIDRFLMIALVLGLWVLAVAVATRPHQRYLPAGGGGDMLDSHTGDYFRRGNRAMDNNWERIRKLTAESTEEETPEIE